jgi:hypothetical protein
VNHRTTNVLSTTAKQLFVKIAFSDTNALDATPNRVPMREKLTSPSVPSCVPHKNAGNKPEGRPNSARANVKQPYHKS